MATKKSVNYLDYIPIHKANLRFESENGKVTIFIENKGIFNLLAQKLFKKPKVSQIHLDEMGNFVWPLIDGSRTIYDIAMIIKDEYGDKAEPLYDRVVQYFKILDGYGFVELTEG